MCPSAVLLRIEFTAPTCLHAAGELLPRLSTLTFPENATRFPGRRYISVALVRGLPLAGVTRYPCPVEPGLSSCAGFRPAPAVVRPAHTEGILLNFGFEVNTEVSRNLPGRDSRESFKF